MCKFEIPEPNQIRFVLARYRCDAQNREDAGEGQCANIHGGPLRRIFHHRDAESKEVQKSEDRIQNSEYGAPKPRPPNGERRTVNGERRTDQIFGLILRALRASVVRLFPVSELNTWLETLWAPWRVEYYQREKRPEFLREAGEAANDAEHFVICRRKLAFLMMNIYPYAAGHLMAVPYRVVSRFSELTDGEKVELLDLASYAERLLEEVVKAQGFNVGWNVGTAAGAGVAEHLHLHIVPRWNGDHNFMTVIGGSRIIPDGLMPLYERLRAATERISF